MRSGSGFRAARRTTELAVLLALSACATSRRATDADIKCYSAGVVIYEARVTFAGVPTWLPIGRGVRFFHEGKIVEVTGDCVVKYDVRVEPADEPPPSFEGI